MKPVVLTIFPGANSRETEPILIGMIDCQLTCLRLKKSTRSVAQAVGSSGRTGHHEKTSTVQMLVWRHGDAPLLGNNSVVLRPIASGCGLKASVFLKVTVRPGETCVECQSAT